MTTAVKAMPRSRSVSMPSILLRVEAVVVLLASLALYIVFGEGWRLFLLLILAPDLTFAGYGTGKKWGALIYNVAPPKRCRLRWAQRRSSGTGRGVSPWH